MSVAKRVSHPEFGDGTVQSVSGQKVTVKFDSGLVKTVDKSELVEMLFS